MGNLELLEKAFALAESGEVENLVQLRKALVKQGITAKELDAPLQTSNAKCGSTRTSNRQSRPLTIAHKRSDKREMSRDTGFYPALLGQTSSQQIPGTR